MNFSTFFEVGYRWNISDENGEKLEGTPPEKYDGPSRENYAEYKQ